ncbi:hypothetical protein ACLOJK_041539 [Asimina triloba]
MSRLSFRPRPLDIHKKLPIVKSIKDFEDDDVTASTRNSQLLRLAAEADEVHHTPTKKSAPEIPIPQFVVVDSYERDYSRTFGQPTSYLRARGARAEIGEFVEYDLDNEDEDWLEEFNRERKIIAPEKLEVILFKLEVLDHKTRERAGIIMPTLSAPVPVLLQLDAAAECYTVMVTKSKICLSLPTGLGGVALAIYPELIEALQSQSIRYSVLQSIYNYWKEKSEKCLWKEAQKYRFNEKYCSKFSEAKGNLMARGPTKPKLNS